jgi:hypothetical protein
MTSRDHEFGEFVRRSLRAAAESVVAGEDGLDRIRGRLAAARPADVASPGVRAVLAARALRVLAGVGAADPGHG